jgi:hypothetical protein
LDPHFPHSLISAIRGSLGWLKPDLESIFRRI